MKRNLITIGSSLLAATAALVGAALSLQAADPEASPATSGQQAKKPNILFIMGDDIGIMQPGCYHQGLMVGETPNIDRIAREGGQLHGLLRHAELHVRALRLLHRHVSGCASA